MNCEGLIQKILNYHAHSGQKYGRGNNHSFMNKFLKNKTNEIKIKTNTENKIGRNFLQERCSKLVYHDVKNRPSNTYSLKKSGDTYSRDVQNS